jgi:adenylate cyclase
VDRVSIQRRLAAVLSADAVGYSRLMSDDATATVRTIAAYREQIGLLVAEHEGRVVDAPGDNLLAEFPSASGAARCALEVQRVLAVRNGALPEARRMAFRIGLHLGEVLAEGERIHGDGVNVAARLEGLAAAGGVVCSAAVRDQLRGEHVAFEDLGERALKNLPAPVRAYRLAPAEKPAELTPEGSAGLAVLPFENLSDDPEQAYFADGITEDLITDLCGVPGLLVTSRTSAFVYKGTRRRAEEIGRELGVRYLLEGSVRRSADRLRITAQLIDAVSGMHLWAQRFDRERTEIFALQDEVTREIVAALRIRLGGALEIQSGHTPAPDPEAYDLCMRGRAYLRRFDRDGLARARALFSEATARDPDFGLAWARLGDCDTVEHAFWAPDGLLLERGIELIAKGCELAPDDPEILTALARARWFTGDFRESADAAEHALALQPGSVDALTELSRAARSLGRFEDGLRAADLAVRLDPLNVFARFERAAAGYFLGRHDEALPDLRWSAQQAPDFLPIYLMLAGCHAAKGQLGEARAAVAELRRLAPSYSIAFMNRQVPGGDVGGALARDLRKAGLPE